MTLPAPIFSSVVAGTLTVSLITEDSAAPVGPLALLVVVAGLEFSLMTTKTTTITMTRAAAPEMSSTRLRTSRRRCAARWAAIRCWRLAPCLVLLALPMALLSMP